MVPDLEEKLVTSVESGPEGYSARARHRRDPDRQAGNPRRGNHAFLDTSQQTYSICLPNSYRTVSNIPIPNRFVDAALSLLGAGSSAIDLAGLLHEAGADVQLVARDTALKFHEKMPMDKPRSLWQQVRSPLSGLGPGLRSRFFANFPNLFHHLPEGYRLETVRTFLGPAGGWFAKDKVVGKVPLVLGFSRREC